MTGWDWAVSVLSLLALAALTVNFWATDEWDRGLGRDEGVDAGDELALYTMLPWV